MLQPNTEKSMPIATTGNIVNEYIDNMKNVLATKQFGKVGLVFTVHEAQVVGVQEIRETRMQVKGEGDD